MTATTIQIYTMQTPQEAEAVVALGVDHVGITPADRGLPGEISVATAQEIVQTIRGRATVVALSVEEEITDIADMVRAVQPDILHLCAPTGAVTPADVKQLRALVPGTPIMQAIAVTGPEALDEALSYVPVVEYLLLDSVDPTIPGVGAAGITHDWAVSAAIVKASTVPVILAGGLAPENVAAAIEAVRPWGVDSLTRTNAPLEGGRFRKDLAAIERFVAAVRGVSAQ